MGVIVGDETEAHLAQTLDDLLLPQTHRRGHFVVLHCNSAAALENVGVAAEKDVILVAMDVHLNHVNYREAGEVEYASQGLRPNRYSVVILFRTSRASVTGIKSCRLWRVDSPVLTGYSFGGVHCLFSCRTRDCAIQDRYPISQVIRLHQLPQPFAGVRKRFHRNDSCARSLPRCVQREHSDIRPNIEDDTE